MEKKMENKMETGVIMGSIYIYRNYIGFIFIWV